jgi:hypothetical protein
MPELWLWQVGMAIAIAITGCFTGWSCFRNDDGETTGLLKADYSSPGARQTGAIIISEARPFFWSGDGKDLIADSGRSNRGFAVGHRRHGEADPICERRLTLTFHTLQY